MPSIVSKYYQLIYFPYLTLSNTECINIGDVQIWNLMKLDELIEDMKLKQRIKQILQAERIDERPVNDIGIVSIGECNLRVFKQNELQNINVAQLIMFISFLAQQNIDCSDPNIGHSMATSENFEFVIQNFRLESKYRSEQIGFISRKVSAGRIEVFTFHAPIHQLLWLKVNRKRLFQRMIRAVRVFFEAYYNSPYVNHSARILLQINAFEILLDLVDRADFKNKIEKYCSIVDEKQYVYYSERYDIRTKGFRKVKEKRTIKGIWADKFYTLRNHIVHGNVVKESEFLFRKKQRHFDIALLFFVLCIKELINDSRTRGRKWRIFYDTISWCKIDDIVNNVKKWVFIYKRDPFQQSLAKHIWERHQRKY